MANEKDIPDSQLSILFYGNIFNSARKCFQCGIGKNLNLETVSENNWI